MPLFDDVCQFDENGVCKRHKVRHIGRFHRLSQDRTSVGHEFRKKWDKTEEQPAPLPPPPVEPQKGCGCGGLKGRAR